MPLLLLISLLIACLPLDWPEPPNGIGVPGSAILTGSVVAGLLIVARAFSLLTSFRIASGVDHVAVARADALRRRLFYYLVIGGLWFIVLRCGWGWASRDLLTAHQYMNDGNSVTEIAPPIPGAEVLVLVPYLIVMIGSWAAFYDSERALHLARPARAGRPEFWSRCGYVAYSLRKQVLMVLLPIILEIIQLSLLRVYPGLATDPWAKAGGFAGVCIFFLLIPLSFPLLLGLKPLEPGPLRSRLESAARRLGVRYRQLYVWDTKGQMATAMVAGLIPQVRQIVFTDLLLAALTDEEVEAVFGHEVGHVRHGHLLYYAGFLILSLLTLGTAYRAVELMTGLPWLHGQVMLVLSFLATFAYLFVVFGFISRRCERQADVFGCKAVSCCDPACGGHISDTQIVPRGGALCPTGVLTFVRALERVEEIDGSARSTGDSRGGRASRAAGLLRFVGAWLSTWQHGTIAKRVDFLHTLDSDTEQRFQRRVTLLRWGLILLLIAGVAGVTLWSGWQAMVDGM
jgi:Zn-dependent protease with chaperone function